MPDPIDDKMTTDVDWQLLYLEILFSLASAHAVPEAVQCAQFSDLKAETTRLAELNNGVYM